MVRPEGRSPKLMATSGGLSPLMTNGEARPPNDKRLMTNGEARPPNDKRLGQEADHRKWLGRVADHQGRGEDAQG